MVDTLKYLAMGGRIGKAQALLGGALQFNPIVGIRDGEAHLTGQNQEPLRSGSF